MTPDRLAAVEARCNAATEGPWSCCDEPCKCRFVSSADHPVAEVTKGEWGDDFSNVRLVRNPDGMGEVAEAFVDRIAYGSVPEAEAMANRAFITHARADIPWLIESLKAALAERDAAREALRPAKELNISDAELLRFRNALEGKEWERVWCRFTQSIVDCVREIRTRALQPADRTPGTDKVGE